MTIEYSRADAHDVAWAAIDRSEAVDIVLRGWRTDFAKRALPLCRFFFESSERPRRTPSYILKMAVFGLPLASLMGVYNHAVLAGMSATWQEAEGAIVVSFRPHSPAST